MKELINKIKKVLNLVNNKWENFINLKYNKYIFKFLPHNLFIFILFIISIFTIIVFYKENNENILYSQTKADAVIDPILVNPVDISFDNIELTGDPTDICFTFATYARINHSNFKFVLYKGEEVVSETQFNASVLKDGGSYCFNTPTITKDNVSEYSAKIVPIYSDSANAITIFKNSQTNELAMKFVNHKRILSIQNLIILIFILIFFFINYLTNKKEYKPEKFWLLISFLYFIAIMFIIPPYQVPDEPVHFWNAYKLTQIDFSKSLPDNFEDKSVLAPSNSDCLGYSHIQFEDKVRSFNDVIECAKSTDNSITSPWYISAGTKLGYIFGAIGIKLADIFTNSPLIIFYAGRLLNLLASIIIIFYAIKVTPKYKNIFLMVGTIPMFIQEMGSYSYDSTLNAVCLLTMAIILKLIFEKNNNWKIDTLILFICALFIANIKLIYLPIFLFLLLIPKEKFKNNKFIKIVYPITIIIIAYLSSGFLQSLLVDNGTIANNIISSGENVTKILKDPLSIFPIAIKTFQVNGWFYIQSLIGYFGWFRYKFPLLLVFAYLIYFGYMICSEEKIEGKWYIKLLIILGILLSIAGVFGAMYFGWTTAGLDYVDGVQGRYFIPLIIPILLICLFKNKEKNKDNKDNNNYNFINIMLLQYIMILLIFYY